MEETSTNLLKLDPEFKAKWVTALRSGKYEQGRSKLAHKEDGYITYCCLGVACIIEGVPLAAIVNEGMPSPAIQQWVGSKLAVNAFLTKNIDSEKGDPHYTLTRMNDDGKSFAEIATWIEENL